MTPMDIGYDKPLFLLPFDHRSSFERGLFGFVDPLSPEQTEAVRRMKRVVYDGFRAAIRNGVPGDAAGILVDEELGADILKDARAAGFITCTSVEKSGQDELVFEYGAEWKQHLDAMDPTFAKVLVRYNPEGNPERNARQRTNLRALSAHVHETSRRLMFELLVPATAAQADHYEGNMKLYDEELRPHLAARAMHELQDAGVEVDVWKLEGLSRRDDGELLVHTAQREGRDHVGCIVLGRGSDEAGIIAWLRTAAKVRGFVGFAVGRASFWDALVALRDGKIGRDEAVAKIAARYVEWVNVFQRPTA